MPTAGWEDSWRRTWKNLASVRTDRQAAPPRSYAWAICRGTENARGSDAACQAGGVMCGGNGPGRCRSRVGRASRQLAWAWCLGPWSAAPMQQAVRGAAAGAPGTLKPGPSHPPHPPNSAGCWLATRLDWVKVGLDDSLAGRGLLNLWEAGQPGGQAGA